MLLWYWEKKILCWLNVLILRKLSMWCLTLMLIVLRDQMILIVLFFFMLVGILLTLMFVTVKQLFIYNWIFLRMNSNVVSLISKIFGADVVTNFHFKIISKILVERLVVITSRIIFQLVCVCARQAYSGLYLCYL